MESRALRDVTRVFWLQKPSVSVVESVTNQPVSGEFRQEMRFNGRMGRSLYLAKLWISDRR